VPKSKNLPRVVEILATKIECLRTKPGNPVSNSCQEKLNEVRKELNSIERKYASTNIIFSQLSIIEKSSLIRLLTEKLKSTASKIYQDHHKMLTIFWLKQRKQSPNCITNLSKVKLSLYRTRSFTLRFGYITQKSSYQ